MKKRNYLISLWGIIILFCLNSCGPKEFAGIKAASLFPEGDNNDTLREAKVLVSTPANEISAIISPDGADILYVSDEQGNCDLFIRPIRGGTATRLTTQSADDVDPVFSPDGKYIAYVSMEEDSKGDIWVMKRGGGSKKRLTQRETADRTPVFSPDGQYIYYVGRKGVRGESAIYRVAVKGGTPQRIRSGFDPAPMADGKHLIFTDYDDKHHTRLQLVDLANAEKDSTFLTDGAYMEGFPHVFLDGEVNRVVFSRFCDDTNGDGRVDGDDQPSLWRLDIENSKKMIAGNAFPLTTGENSEIFGTMNGDLLVFTSTDLDDEAKALPLDGIVPRQIASETLYEIASSSDNKAVRRTLLRYLVSRGGSSESHARYELAKDMAESGQYGLAREELAGAMAISQEDPAFLIVLKLEDYRLEVIEKESRLPSDKARPYLTESFEKLPEIHQISDDDDITVRARYETVWAELAYRCGKRGSISDKLTALLTMENVPLEDIARAHRLLADMAWQLEQINEARRYEMATLRLAAPLDYHKKQAVEQLLAHNVIGVTLEADWRTLADTSTDLPILATEAMLKLAGNYYQNNNILLAEQEYERLLEQYPRQNQAAVIALKSLSDIGFATGKTSQALDYLERIISEYPAMRAAVKEARLAIKVNALKNAREEEQSGNYEEAMKNYQRMIRTDDSSLIAHRRFIAMAEKLNKLPDVMEWYRQGIVDNPTRATYLYAYGLCLTYLGTDKLNEATDYIKKALDYDSRMPEAHLTMGWIEEQRYRKKLDSDRLEKALDYYSTALNEGSESHTIAAANLNLGNGFFLMGKDDMAFTYYLAREMDSEPFESKEVELLFRERFGRVALRQEYYDVALTELNDAEVATRESSYSRRAEILMLLAVVSYSIEEYEQSASWFDQAAEIYKKQKKNDKLLTALRAQGYALELCGQYKKAENVLSQALAILKKNGGPVAHKYDLLEFEMAIETNNVTRAPYGFDAQGEEELLNGKLATLAGQSGQLETAYEYYIHKLALLEKAKKNSHVGDAVDLELIYTYNELGRLMALLGDLDGAYDSFSSAWKLAEHDEFLDLDGKLISAANIFDLLRFGFSIPDEFINDYRKFMPQAKENCRGARRPLCVSLLISQSAWQLADNVGRQNWQPLPLEEVIKELTASNEQLAEALDLAREAVNMVNDSHTEEYKYDGYSDMEVAGQALLAHGQAIYGDLEGARKLAAENLARASEKLRWRLIYDQSKWDSEQRQQLLGLAIAALNSGRNTLTRPTLWARDFRNLTIDAFTQLPEEDSDFILLQLADIWRSLQLETKLWGPLAGSAAPETAFVPAKLAEKLGPDLYLFHLELAEKELILLVSGGKSWKFYGSKEEATAWLAEKAGQPERIYLDSLDDNAWLLSALPAPEKAPLVVMSPQPSLLKIALEKQGFSTLDPLYIGSDEQLKTARIDGNSDLQTIEDQANSRLWVMVDTPIILSDNGLPEQPVADGKKVYTSPKWQSPLVIFSNVELPGNGCAAAAASINIYADMCKSAAAAKEPDLLQAYQRKRLAADPQLLAMSRLVADAMHHGATLVLIGRQPNKQQLLGILDSATDELRNEVPAAVLANRDLGADWLLYGAAGLDKKGRTAVAKSQYSSATSAGVNWYKKRNWQEAKIAFSQSIMAMNYLGKPAAVVQSKLAEVYVNMGDVDRAIPEQIAVRDYYLGLKKYKEASEADRLLGKIYFNIKNYGASANSFIQAAAGFGKGGQVLDQADSLTRAGTACSQNGQYEEALNHYRQALELYQKANNIEQFNVQRYIGIILENNYSNYRGAMQAYQAVYDAYILQGNEVKARTVLLDLIRVNRSQANYAKALELSKQALLGLGAGETQLQAEILLETARIYWYRGEYRLALSTNQQVLDIARLLGDIFLEIQANSLKGLIARNQGQLENAESFLNQALNLAMSTGRESEVATQLNNLGIVQREMGLVDKSIETFTQALRIDEKQNNKDGIAYDDRNLAISLMEKGELKQAEEKLLASMAISEVILSKFNTLECTYALGQLKEKQTQFKEAEQYFSRASKLSRELSVPDLEWRALYSLARLSITAGNKDEAGKQLSAAIQLVESIGRSGGQERTPTRQELYGEMVKLLLEDGQAVSALEFFERYRQRVFLDFISGRSLNLEKRPGYELWQEVEAINGKMEAGGDQMTDYDQLAERKQALREQLSRDYPLLAQQLFVSQYKIDFEKLPLPEESGLLAVFPTADGLALWWWDRENGLSGQLQKTDIAKFKNMISQLENRLANYVPLDDYLSQLGELILSPFADKLLHVKQVAFLLDGSVATIPLAALVLNEKNLMEHDIATWQIPSLFLLSGQQGEVTNILVAGRGSVVTPFAKLEVTAIRAEQQALINKNNNWRPSRKSVASGTILHLAGYTTIDIQDPLDSTIRFDDNIAITLQDILAHNRMPPMVVLSSCNGSGGQNAWQGFARAFMLSGAQTVVASSSRVSDLTSALLMKHFYRYHIGEKESAVRALHHAQKQVASRYPYPAYWATYSINGFTE